MSTPRVSESTFSEGPGEPLEEGAALRVLHGMQLLEEPRRVRGEALRAALGCAPCEAAEHLLQPLGQGLSTSRAMPCCRTTPVRSSSVRALTQPRVAGGVRRAPMP